MINQNFPTILITALLYELEGEEIISGKVKTSTLMKISERNLKNNLCGI